MYLSLQINKIVCHPERSEACLPQSGISLRCNPHRPPAPEGHPAALPPAPRYAPKKKRAGEHRSPARPIHYAAAKNPPPPC